MATINIEQIASEIRRVDGDCAGIMDDFQCIKGFCGKLSDVLTDTSAFAIPADLKNIFTPILADFVLYIFNCRKRNMKIIDVQLEGSIRGFEEFVLHCKNTEPDVEDLFVNEANNELNLLSKVPRTVDAIMSSLKTANIFEKMDTVENGMQIIYSIWKDDPIDASQYHPKVVIIYTVYTKLKPELKKRVQGENIADFTATT